MTASSAFYGGTDKVDTREMIYIIYLEADIPEDKETSPLKHGDALQ